MRVHSLPALLAHQVGTQRRASRRLAVDRAHRQVAEERERQRPRDRRGGHQDQVAAGRLGGDGGSLRDPELVLLVDHHQPQVGEANRLGEHGVSAQQHVDVAGRQGREQVGPGRPVGASGQQSEPHPQRLQQPRRGLRMLVAERLRRDDDRHLPAGVDHARGRQQRHQGLAAAHVSLQQPGRGVRPIEIFLDLGQDGALRAREREREPLEHRCLQPSGPPPGRRARPAGRRAARQLELQQKQLLVGQRTPRPFGLLGARRTMDTAQRRALVGQAAVRGHVPRQQIAGGARGPRKGVIDQAAQQTLREPGGGRIYGQQRSGRHLFRAHQLEAAGLEPAVAAVEPAVHQDRLPGRQRPPELRPAERVQRGPVAVVVGNRDRGRAAAAEPEGADAHHGRADAGVGAGGDLRQRQRPPAVLVAARQVHQQVADGLHAEPTQPIPRGGADAAQCGYVIVPPEDWCGRTP